MKLVSFLFRYSRVATILAIVIGAVGGVLNAGLVATIHAALKSPAGKSELLWQFIALTLAVPSLKFCSSVLMTSLSQRGIYDIRKQLAWQVAASPLRRLEEVGSHRILVTLTEDIFVITNLLISLPVLCMQSMVLIGCLVYLAWLSWIVFAAVLLFIVLGAISFRLAVGRATRYLMKARDYADRLMTHFHALTDGAKELKLHRLRRTRFVSNVMEESAMGLRNNNVTGTKITTVSSSLLQLLFCTLIGLLLFVLPRIQPVDTASLTGYLIAIFYMSIPIEDLMRLIPASARANIAMGRIESLGLSLEEGRTESQIASQATETFGVDWKRLELAGATHTYYRERENSNFTLGPINLVVKPGELIFLVGGNGSGKTTLAKVLTGLYNPECGEIWLNGIRVADKNRDDYRQLFSVVFFDFFLFDALIGLDADNLDERAHQHLVRLQLDHKVEIKDGKLSTIDLSQGQRKRLALLTALLEDRPFYVFDEWAADQDAVFREVFYLSLLPELKARGKTVIVISHDDRYYHVGDRIIKLDSGNVVYDRQPVASEVDSVVVACTS